FTVLSLGIGCAPQAQGAESTYPAKPVRLIVPYAPDGGGDGVERPMAHDLAPRPGQPIASEQRAGGGGAERGHIATPRATAVCKRLVGSVAVASMPGMFKKLSFDPVRDFAPVSVSMSGTYLLGVNLALPVDSVQSLIALAKAKPGALNLGSSGGGSTIHLAG